MNKFRDAIAVGGDTQVHLVWLKRRKDPLEIKIPEVCRTMVEYYGSMLMIDDYVYEDTRSKADPCRYHERCLGFVPKCNRRAFAYILESKFAVDL